MAGLPKSVNTDTPIDSHFLSYMNSNSTGGNTTNITTSKDSIKQYVKTKNGIFNGAFGSVAQILVIASGVLNLTKNSTGVVVVRRTVYVQPESSTTDTLDSIELNGLELPNQELILMSSTGNTITIAHNASASGTRKNIYCPGDTSYALAPHEAVVLIYDAVNTIWIVTGSEATSGADNLGNHTATQDLDMSNNTIIDFNGLDQQNANTTGAINLVNNSSIRWKDTAGTGEGIFRLNNLDNFSFTHSIDMSSKNITAIEKAVFSNSGIPSAGEVAIGAITGDMYFEALSNDSFYFRINGTTQVEIDEDGLDIRNGWLELEERTAPTGLSNHTRLYAKDNGSGKTQLVVIFGSGVEQVIATEP
jgi:hypothetical protein